MGPRGGLGEDRSGRQSLAGSNLAAPKPRPAWPALVHCHHFAALVGTWEHGLEVTSAPSAPQAPKCLLGAPPAWCLVLNNKKQNTTSIKTKKQTPEEMRRSPCARPASAAAPARAVAAGRGGSVPRGGGVARLGGLVCFMLGSENPVIPCLFARPLGCLSLLLKNPILAYHPVSYSKNNSLFILVIGKLFTKTSKKPRNFFEANILEMTIILYLCPFLECLKHRINIFLSVEQNVIRLTSNTNVEASPKILSHLSW